MTVKVSILADADAATSIGKGCQNKMMLLLEQRGADVVITDEVVKAAAGNRESGKEVMRPLLEQRGSDGKITSSKEDSFESTLASQTN